MFYLWFTIGIFCLLVVVALIAMFCGLVKEGDINIVGGIVIFVFIIIFSLCGWKVIKEAFVYRAAMKQIPQKSVVVPNVTLIKQPPPVKELTLEEKIKAKISEITNLRNNLQQKEAEISDLLFLYSKGIENLRREVLNEMSNKSIDSFEKAISDQKIIFDFTLIQRKIAYIQKLNEINQRIKLGIIELEFKGREAEDDLALVKVLPREEIEKFVGEINNLIKKYQPETNDLVIEIDEQTLLSHRRIYDEIIVGNKTKLEDLRSPSLNPLPSSTSEHHP